LPKFRCCHTYSQPLKRTTRQEKVNLPHPQKTFLEQKAKRSNNLSQGSVAQPRFWSKAGHKIHLVPLAAKVSQA
jgi:hypothetical protein